MWSTYAPGDGGPDDDLLRRMSEPENELPTALPLNRVLVRNDDVAIALVGLQAYTTGVSFHLVVRARPSAEAVADLNDLFWGPRHRGAPRFLLGVEFADGRRAGNVPGGSGPAELVFHSGGGSGGESSVEQSWWLSPLPPDGPLRFVARCSELGLPETVLDLDGAAIRRAGEGATVLWPWERPSREDPEPPVPPADLPPDSWFART